MTFPLIAAFGQTVFALLLGAVALFLILLVLVQRGRGGGLAGALGGVGGSSAFGAKAGDVFTKITCVTAFIWIVLCIAATKMTPEEEKLVDTGVTSSTTTSTEVPSLTGPATEEDETTAEDSEESTSTDEPAGTSTEEPSTDSTPESTE